MRYTEVGTVYTMCMNEYFRYIGDPLEGEENEYIQDITRELLISRPSNNSRKINVIFKRTETHFRKATNTRKNRQTEVGFNVK